MPPVCLGDVFAIKFDHIDHEKYVVIAGITESGSYICTVFINSVIHEYIINHKPHLVPFHVVITQNKNRFLRYNSFIGCDYHKFISIQSLQNSYDLGLCRLLGQLDGDDFIRMKCAIIDTGLLSAEEQQYYFQIPII